MLKKICLLLLLFVNGCAEKTYINDKEHYFGLIPKRIIWLQVEGLDFNHLSFLKFSYPDAKIKTAFENSTCIGQTWGYNLFQIRPMAFDSFWSQITGSQNVKNNEYKQKTLFEYLRDADYRVGIFESLSDGKKGLIPLKKILGEDVFNEKFRKMYLWKMPSPEELVLTKGHLEFHAQKKKELPMGQVLTDESCSQKGCFSTLLENVMSEFNKTFSKDEHYFFLIQDYSLAYYLKRKNVFKAREILEQLDKMYSFFLAQTTFDKDVMVLVTSASPIPVEFPEQGKKWTAFENEGKFLIYKKSTFLAPLFASGARSETFCGIFEENKIFKKIVEAPLYRKILTSISLAK